MIKVFKTDIKSTLDADKISEAILLKYPNIALHFDMEDEDRILRVEGVFFTIADIAEILEKYRYTCIDLPIELD